MVPIIKKNMLKHLKCINGLYPRSNIHRFVVPEALISWNEKYPDYKPVSYESPVLAGKEWADPGIGKLICDFCLFKSQSFSFSGDFEPKFNAIDDDINRVSFVGEYEVTDEGYPVNPIGRTGIIGRGLLGRWGPNHAADPIVSTFKRNDQGDIVVNPNTQK